MSEFTIIIPIYNEEENLLRLEAALVEYFQIAPFKTSVLFVNDGSTDGCEEMIIDICERNKDFQFIAFRTNQGISSALKAGFDWVQSPLIGYMDGDLQTHPEDFNLLLKHIDTYDLITGIRIGRKDRFATRISSKIGNGIRRFFTNDGMKDTGCPLKVIKADYAKRIPMFKGFHRFLPAMVLLQKGKVHQVSVRHFSRKGGKGNFGIGNRIFGPLAACFVYLWMKRNYIHFEIKDHS